MSECIDIAVIGGGIAGCFAAWRLQRARRGESPLLDALRHESSDGLTVGLFEASERIGGRLHSHRDPVLPGVPIELGGTGLYLPRQPNPRFSGHWRMARLLDHLKIECLPFESGTALNPHYLRGHHLREGDFGDQDRGIPFNQATVPYQLGADHPYLDNVLGDAFNQIVPGVTSRSEAEIQDICRTAQFQGRPLHEWSMKDALESVLSSEAWQFLNDTTPLRPTITIPNAADGMVSYLCNEMAGFTPYYMRDGNDTVCTTLEGQLDERSVRIRHKLVQIMKADGDRFTLVFENGEQWTARCVVLALPRSPLQAVLGKSELFSDEARAQLDSDLAAVHPVPTYIAFQIYPYPFWRRSGMVAGISLMDDWSREIWVRQTLGEVPGAKNKDDQRSVVMHAWRDEESIQGLSAFVSGRLGLEAPTQGHVLANLTDDHKRAIGSDLGEQMRRLFQLDYIPPALAHIDRHWDHGHEAFHMWLPGARSSEIAARMLQPSPDLPLYICGEAYSQNQGWMEGALTTTVEMLKKLGLSDPLNFT